MDKRDERPIEITGIRSETTFSLELPERAVRALSVIGQFGAGSLAKAVGTVLSPSEAQRHAYGLEDIQRIGNVAKAALQRLDDARSVAEGRKIAVDREKTS
jgi:hypothetical protein